MHKLIKEFEQEHKDTIAANKVMPIFRAGDTVCVSVRVIDGVNERLQEFEGVVIAKRSRGISSSFVVRKISHGIGVERRFKVYSPIVNSVKVIKRGDVRRGKLYYLRNLSGKAARIKEKVSYAPRDAKVEVAKSE